MAFSYSSTAFSSWLSRAACSAASAVEEGRFDLSGLGCATTQESSKTKAKQCAYGSAITTTIADT